MDEICQFLILQYELGIKLRGIIYLHHITDRRMQGSARRYFEMFQRLIGEKNMGHVVLMTTMWSELNDEGTGLERESKLRNEFWNVMEKKGSQIRSFDGSRGMAQAIVCRMTRKDPIVLQIQEELVDLEMLLDQTAVGKFLLPRLEARVQESAGKLAEIEEQLMKLDSTKVNERNKLQKQRVEVKVKKDEDEKSRQKMKKKLRKELKDDLGKKTKGKKWKDRAQLFASIIGLAVTVTVNLILPLPGVAVC